MLQPIIGLMSGTSMDGIDASLVHTDGLRLTRTGHAMTIPYDGTTRAMILDAIAERVTNPGLDRRITAEHIIAVEKIIKAFGTRPAAIGFHGQTIFHDPHDEGITIQAGDAAYMAKKLGIPVVHDFRRADIIAGGEGAPLAPVYHRAIMEELNLPLPAAIANIGGITNITVFDGENVSGCDTGPGNAAMDALAAGTLATGYDKDGALAAQGTPDEAWVAGILGNPFFTRPGPKSLDRSAVLEFARSLPASSTAPDRMASLAMLTAAALGLQVGKSVRHLVLTGGGARNPVLVAMIRARISRPTAITLMDDHGIDGDFIEAELMAFLAARCMNNLPITFPGTTAVPRAMTGGVIASP